MLKIENYYKLCNKAVGGSGWRVLYCYELPDWYEICLEHQNHQLASPVKVRLSRNPKKMPNGRMVYKFLDESGNPMLSGVTADWLVDMNNMLKKLKDFVTI